MSGGRIVAVHRPTAVRAAVLSAGMSLVLYAVVSVLGATLIDLWGAGSARGVALLAGVVLRLLAGRWAARAAWGAGADLPLVLASVAAGGAVGWLAFPGLLSLIGLAAGSDAAAGAVKLLVDLVVWVACLCVGAASARAKLPPLRRAVTAPAVRRSVRRR